MIELKYRTSSENEYETVKSKIKASILMNSKVIETEEKPFFIAIEAYGPDSISLVIRFWCLSGDYWDVLFTANQHLKQLLDSNILLAPNPPVTHVRNIS